MKRIICIAISLLAALLARSEPTKPPVGESGVVHELPPTGTVDRELDKLRKLVQHGGPPAELHGKLIGAKAKSEASYVLKGNALDELGFPEDAKTTYDELLSLQPSSYWGYLNLGVCELTRGNFEAARDASKKARDLKPGRVSPYFNLARAAALAGCDYEERDALKKLLEVGKDDPRAGPARARIKELDTIDLAVDDTNPFATIALNEKLAHAAWRSKKHRERFPEACGYVLTFEEEKEILSTVVLPDLRKAKDNNPAASEPRYDALLRVGDAGFLDEYIYDTETKALGAPALAWLSAHAERKAAYEDWARKEGILKDPSAPTAEPDLPADVLSAIHASKSHYFIDRGRPSETGRFFEVERQRFRAEPSLQRGDEIDCVKADVVLAAVRNRDVGIPGGTFTEADGIHVHVMKPEWLAYLTAKAAWRNETALRKKYGGAEAYAPSVEEEVFAFRAASQGYGDGRTQSQGTFEQVPMLDRVMEIDRSGHLRGFVLYEVLHRHYGMTIRAVTPKDAADVDAYLHAYVFGPAGQAP